jgi:uncharacterized protein YmfQ (DUF2313 family)
MSESYGIGSYSGYYKGLGIDEESDELHYNALKKTWTLRNVDGSFDDMLHIEGTFLDNCYFNGKLLEEEIFPDSAVDTITDWLRTYGLAEDTTEPNDAVVAAMRVLINKDGRMTKAFIQSIVESYGFTGVTIVERIDYSFIVSDDALPFLATEIDDTGAWVSDGWAQWEFEIHMTGGPTNTSTRSMMESQVFKMKPAFTMGYFYYDY